MVDIKAVDGGGQQTRSTTAEDEQAMTDAINSVALSIAMNAGSRISTQLADMKKASEEAAEESEK